MADLKGLDILVFHQIQSQFFPESPSHFGVTICFWSDVCLHNETDASLQFLNFKIEKEAYSEFFGGHDKLILTASEESERLTLISEV